MPQKILDRAESDITKQQTLGSLQLRHKLTNAVILIPTPTDDPNDPLNWSSAYRYYIALLVSLAIFFCNFLAAGPSVAMLDVTTTFYGAPGPDLDSKIAKVSYFFTTTSLLQGLSNLIWMPLIVKFGRRPVYVLSYVIYTACAAWAGGASSYGSELAARILMGLGSGAAECLAPLTISDIFFLHERGAIMAIYTCALSAGVGGGILISGLITISHNWRMIYWVAVALIGASTVLIVLTFPETEFTRSATVLNPSAQTFSPSSTKSSHLKEADDTKLSAAETVSTHQPPKPRTYAQYLRLYTGIHTREPLLKLFLRPIILLALPPVLWATLVMSVTIGFLVAITSNFAAAFASTYSFAPWQSGLCFVSALIGSFVGIFFGGRFSDWVADVLTRRNGGVREPEMRLPAMGISLCTAPLALVLYGVGVGERLHWIVAVLGLGFLNFSIVQATNVSLVYAIDAYRPVAGEITVTQLGFKSAFGFLLSFYTNPWITEAGYPRAFGAMAAISGSVLVLSVPLYFWGKRVRHATWKCGVVRRGVEWDEDREVGE